MVFPEKTGRVLRSYRLFGSWNINNRRRRNRGGVSRAPQEEPPKSRVLYCRLIIVNASVKLQLLIPYLVAGDLSLHFLEVYFWNTQSCRQNILSQQKETSMCPEIMIKETFSL